MAEVSGCDSRVLEGELGVLGSSSNLILCQATTSGRLDFFIYKMGVSFFSSS